MAYNKDKVDEVTLALLHLVMEKGKDGARAWKGFDWETMNRLHEKGHISNPKSKANEENEISAIITSNVTSY